jgi:DNA-damage-inducible protein J
MANATIQIRTDASVKAQADSIFRQMGMTLSQGLNIFLRQVVVDKGMPFQPKLTETVTSISPQTTAEIGQINRAEITRKIKQFREHLNPVTMKEIMEWRDEGRK